MAGRRCTLWPDRADERRENDRESDGCAEPDEQYSPLHAHLLSPLDGGRAWFAAPRDPVRYVPGMDWEQSVIWITTRTIRPGSYEEFRKAWRPSAFPEGMVRAYECFSEDRSEVVGISVWESYEARERYRLSDVEAERQRAMAPFVEAESSGLYVGRELKLT